MQRNRMIRIWPHAPLVACADGVVHIIERDLIRERTVAGMAAARARGRVGGRPAIMTPDKLAVARRMLADGKSKTAVAKTIGVSRPTLYAHLGTGGMVGVKGRLTSRPVV